MSRLSAAWLLFVVFPVVAGGEDGRGGEIPSAMRAGPAGIGKEATSYVVGRGEGFGVARKGTNGFACLVNRRQRDTVEPECCDPEGVETLMKVEMDHAKMRE